MIHKTMMYRRKQERLHKKKLKKIADYCGYPGVWEFKPNCFRSVRSKRAGNASQVLKKIANKKVRHSNLCFRQKSSYKKAFDYWWKLT